MHSITYSCFYAVVSAEVLTGSHISDVVFPTSPDQLGNFSQGTNESVQITIPADALNSLTTADSEPSKMCIDAFYLLFDCGV